MAWWSSDWWPMAAAAAAAVVVKHPMAAAAAVVVVKHRFSRFIIVKGWSMLPTFQARGDVALLKHHRWMYDFSRGDVVVFRTPYDPRRQAAKRLIGLPGDWIQMPEKREIRQVPDGHCWVEGDNASHSHDSRQYGPIPLGLMEGRITHIIWPPNRIRRVDRMMPQGRVLPRHFYYKPRH